MIKWALAAGLVLALVLFGTGVVWLIVHEPPCEDGYADPKTFECPHSDHFMYADDPIGCWCPSP